MGWTARKSSVPTVNRGPVCVCYCLFMDARLFLGFCSFSRFGAVPGFCAGFALLLRVAAFSYTLQISGSSPPSRARPPFTLLYSPSYIFVTFFSATFPLYTKLSIFDTYNFFIFVSFSLFTLRLPFLPLSPLFPFFIPLLYPPYSPPFSFPLPFPPVSPFPLLSSGFPWFSVVFSARRSAPLLLHFALFPHFGAFPLALAPLFPFRAGAPPLRAISGCFRPAQSFRRFLSSAAFRALHLPVCLRSRFGRFRFSSCPFRGRGRGRALPGLLRAAFRAGSEQKNRGAGLFSRSPVSLRIRFYFPPLLCPLPVASAATIRNASKQQIIPFMLFSPPPRDPGLMYVPLTRNTAASRPGTGRNCEVLLLTYTRISAYCFYS